MLGGRAVDDEPEVPDFGALLAGQGLEVPFGGTALDGFAIRTHPIEVPHDSTDQGGTVGHGIYPVSDVVEEFPSKDGIVRG